MYKELQTLLNGDDFSVAESFSLAGRPARWREIPDWIAQGPVGRYLSRTLANENQLWKHQSLALEQIGEQKNVVVSTGTASGKSLIFRSAAFDEILRDDRARVLVFYPLKALAADQMRGWEKMAQELGLPGDTVGRIDGSVIARQREEILKQSRIIIMTPDVCHAWLMTRLSMPVITDFLRRVSQIVMDEAHTLEGVFGSNFAFLLLRIFAARTRFKEGLGPQLQLIASTATIANPESHMQELTGAEFVAISDKDDGSPRYERLCAHVVCPPGEEMIVARKIQESLVETDGESGFITFVDSRKGVEVLSRDRGANEEERAEARIMPYRAGYAAEDREKIESKLQMGALKGVISTSALELGIDLPHLSVGLNIGVPPTRKSYRQRVGRVGRSQKGAFVVIAPRNAFKGFGTSYEEYHNLSVEPSYLYLDNQFMQFAHARCLYEELESMAAGTELPKRIGWPHKFSEIYGMARPDGNRPQKFDGIAQLGGDQPQLKYPLRNVGEINFKIAEGKHSEGFGDVNESQALRECYPGGVYLHMGQAYEITNWEMSGFSPCIRVQRTKNLRRKTKPKIMTWINTGILPGDLQEGNILIGGKGFIAESEMQITEKVEGFTDEQNEYHAYSELRAKNPNLRPRHRNFRTTGVILCLKEPWFKKDEVKKKIADWMTQVFCREFSILPQDVGSSATRITVRTQNEPGIRGDCIVIFDQTYGSLRLTERFFTEFDAILERLRGSAQAEEATEREELLGYVEAIGAAYGDFSDALQLGALPGEEGAELGNIFVFTPGSKVYYREAGAIGTEVEVKKPGYYNGELMYKVRVESRRPRARVLSHWVSARYIEPSGDGSAWSYRLWDPEEEEYVEED